MSYIPLAEQIRPTSLEEIAGQEHLLTDNSLIKVAMMSGRPLSILLWGPPGCGKTTLAKIYAKAFNAKFISLTAIFSGVADLKKIIKDAEDPTLFARHTILFVDEIHRFNKAQQDAFLPFLEKGTITLIGATTENPSFALNNALLSRLRVLKLNSLHTQALEKIYDRFTSLRGSLQVTPEGKQLLLHLSQGDARHLLNMIEFLFQIKTDTPLDEEGLKKILQKRSALFDRAGDGHYNLISALHKAVRGSDPDASLYWFARMIEGGEEPLFIARRLIRMAVEDVGLADPEALKLAIAAKDAFEMLGPPEGELALAEVVVYLALAAKSNALYVAYGKAKDLAENSSEHPPPSIILNAPTKLMKEIGYGKGYQYDPDTTHGFSGQNYFPDQVPREQFYHPVERGFEREMKKRRDYFDSLRKKLHH